MKISKRDCNNCRNNFYNHNNMGLNMKDGKPECWSLATATWKKALDIPTDLKPPYTHLKETKRPHCYKADYYVRVPKENLTKDGYWR